MGLIKRLTVRPGARAVGLAAVAVLASAVLVLAAASLVGCGPGTTETQETASGGGGGDLDFNGKTLDGVDVSLGGYRGKPLVLAFMASW